MLSGTESRLPSIFFEKNRPGTEHLDHRVLKSVLWGGQNEMFVVKKRFGGFVKEIIIMNLYQLKIKHLI